MFFCLTMADGAKYTFIDNSFSGQLQIQHFLRLLAQEFDESVFFRPQKN